MGIENQATIGLDTPKTWVYWVIILYFNLATRSKSLIQKREIFVVRFVRDLLHPHNVPHTKYRNACVKEKKPKP